MRPEHAGQYAAKQSLVFIVAKLYGYKLHKSCMNPFILSNAAIALTCFRKLSTSKWLSFWVFCHLRRNLNSSGLNARMQVSWAYAHLIVHS